MRTWFNSTWFPCTFCVHLCGPWGALPSEMPCLLQNLQWGSLCHAAPVLHLFLLLTPVRQKYKGIWICLSILTRALGGNYVNFGVFELYGDPALKVGRATRTRLCVLLWEAPGKVRLGSRQQAKRAALPCCTRVCARQQPAPPPGDEARAVQVALEAPRALSDACLSGWPHVATPCLDTPWIPHAGCLGHVAQDGPVHPAERHPGLQASHTCPYMLVHARTWQDPCLQRHSGHASLWASLTLPRAA